MTKKPTWEEFDEMPDVDIEPRGNRRSYHIELWIRGPDASGTFWAAQVWLHEQEGIADHFGFDPYPVHLVEKTVKVWEPVPKS